MSNNLEILNVGTTPTFVTKTREKNVTAWKVITEPSLSDHRIIEFRLEGLNPSTLSMQNPKKPIGNYIKPI